MANAATGASAEFARGLIGVPAGLAILAKGAALAAGVAAITGAAVKGISAGGGGGAEGPASPGLQAPAAELPSPVTGLPPTITEGGARNIINISGGDLLQQDVVSRRIVDEIARLDSL
jgi:hypothetical protein